MIDDSHFAGTGWLTVLNGPSGVDYDDWAGPIGFHLIEGPGGNDDGDLLSNEDEYAFGLDPTSGSPVNPFPLPLNAASGTFSYTRRNASVYSTGLSYSYQYSTTLDEISWTPVAGAIESSDGGDPVETVTVTLPPVLLGNPNLFVRVIAE